MQCSLFSSSWSVSWIPCISYSSSFSSSNVPCSLCTFLICNDVQYSSSAGTCEAMPLSVTAVPSGWWCGWRTPMPQCRMSCVLDRRTWRTSVSMIWPACTTNASQRVRNTWASWPCLCSSWHQYQATQPGHPKKCKEKEKSVVFSVYPIYNVALLLELC